MATSSQQRLTEEEQELLNAALRKEDISWGNIMLLHLVFSFLLSLLPVRHIPSSQQPGFGEKILYNAPLVGAILFAFIYFRTKNLKEDITQGTKVLFHTSVTKKLRFYAEKRFTIYLHNADNNNSSEVYDVSEEDYNSVQVGESLCLEYSPRTKLLFALRRNNGTSIKLQKAPKRFLLPDEV